VYPPRSVEIWAGGMPLNEPFPCQKGVVPVHGYRNVTSNPNFTIILFPFWVKPYPLQQKKGGVKFAPKGLSAWACLLGKIGAFLETLETRFLATTWVLGVLQYAP